MISNADKVYDEVGCQCDFVDIYFSQQEECPIGGIREKWNKIISSDDIEIPVAMRFHKIESIDSVIRALVKVRNILIKLQIKSDE